jgi:hypothetical protein
MGSSLKTRQDVSLQVGERIRRGIYAGDARLTDYPPGREGVVIYSLDLATRVSVARDAKPEEIVALKIVRGQLIVQRKFVNTGDLYPDRPS